MPKSSLKPSIFIIENIRRHYDLLTQAYMHLESHSLPLSSPVLLPPTGPPLPK